MGVGFLLIQFNPQKKELYMIKFDTETENTPTVSIKVIGVGGAGGNTVNSITGLSSIECIVANTDAQALNLSKAQHTIHIGVKSTRGLGTGANPDLGKRAAEEDLDRVIEAVGEAGWWYRIGCIASDCTSIT
jgi:cell division protein FtsZ